MIFTIFFSFCFRETRFSVTVWWDRQRNGKFCLMSLFIILNKRVNTQKNFCFKGFVIFKLIYNKCKTLLNEPWLIIDRFLIDSCERHVLFWHLSDWSSSLLALQFFLNWLLCSTRLVIAFLCNQVMRIIIICSFIVSASTNSGVKVERKVA